jgi:hypothetical protein
VGIILYKKTSDKDVQYLDTVDRHIEICITGITCPECKETVYVSHEDELDGFQCFNCKRIFLYPKIKHLKPEKAKGALFHIEISEPYEDIVDI